jgi:hypothetical protein
MREEEAMPSDGRPRSSPDVGLAGGPQPSPPGVSDQTPEIHRVEPEPLTPTDAERRAEKVAHRSGAARNEDDPERREPAKPER